MAVRLRREELIDQRPSRMDVSRGVLLPTSVPKPNAKWHPIAKRLFKSFASSGQVRWWQDSDWATAYMLMDEYSAYKRTDDAALKSRAVRAGWDEEAAKLSPKEREAAGWSRERPKVSAFASPQKLDSILRALERLLVTEADRRKARIELEAPVDAVDAPSVAVLDDYRKGLGLT